MMRELSEKASVGGIVLGHLKGLAKTEDGVFSVSSTRAGVVDERAGDGWADQSDIPSFSLVLDLITVTPLDVDESAIWALIEGR